MDRLMKRIAEAKVLGLKGEALLRFLGVRLAGIGDAITFDARKAE